VRSEIWRLLGLWAFWNYDGLQCVFLRIVCFAPTMVCFAPTICSDDGLQCQSNVVAIFIEPNLLIQKIDLEAEAKYWNTKEQSS
jgi:hypothetical protein